MFNKQSSRAQKSFRNDIKRGKQFNKQSGKKLGHPIKRGKQAWSQ